MLIFGISKHDEIENKNGLKYGLYTGKTFSIVSVFRFDSFRIAKLITLHPKTNAFAMQNDYFRNEK